MSCFWVLPDILHFLEPNVPNVLLSTVSGVLRRKNWWCSTAIRHSRLASLGEDSFRPRTFSFFSNYQWIQ